MYTTGTNAVRLGLIFVLTLAFFPPSIDGNGGTDTIVGIQGKGFILMGGDTSFNRNIIVMQREYSKVCELDAGTKLMAVSGEPSHAALFTSILQRNLCLMSLEGNSGPVSLTAAAHFARHQIAGAFRQQQRQGGGGMMVQVLLGGLEPSCPGGKPEQATLWWLDNYGAMQRVTHGAHGYASNIILSILDREVKPEMDIKQAVKVMLKCFSELQTRYLINTSPGFQMKVIDPNGCYDITGNDYFDVEKAIN
mmetsp:Transcript_14338/g.21093  ORF Transcript_14338/g.21093 Transcript_14338/m.21093 type:complete len:250 (-) Transcript_14338:95-844(-)|eukprot:CAMPEP_0113953018 /NCGR_PEP_ID=MMETSP1339-20121228/90749_1 /TAXON_ID=94617 /ORGANISM="Fibrocapsa japonica" /LENGTH=249 /DNA_ID=CAMNT_0000961713 /DNA_START=16 /DNA_END=765 /DNA_ORIENTATION=- /assembly_acc=CAM_ASM_000762